MPPVLSILMPALSFREQSLARKIRQQISALGEHNKLVEFIADVDSGEKTSGAKRQSLFEASSGERVCFVDDDDDVHDRYVEELVKASLLWVDRSVITFNLHMTMLKRQRLNKMTHRQEVWRFGLWKDNRKAGMMSANHLCAWRREIAGLVAWDPSLGYADDQMWYQPILNNPSLSLTEQHIDFSLYHYRFSPITTVNQKANSIALAKRKTAAGVRCFDLHGRIYIEARSAPAKTGFFAVRSNSNEVVYIPDSTPHYHVIKML